MDKKQAAEFLGVSTRTIENYAKEGKISVAYISGKNGKQAQYNEGELKAFKEELEMPVHRSFVASSSSEITSAEVFGGLTTVPKDRVVELLEAISGAQRLALLWNKLVWSLEEAAIATGYSRFHLRQAIALGDLPAKKVGKGWKVRPQDLRDYTRRLFGDTAQNRSRMAGLEN
ncbi:hypothetical protein A6S26_05430 [Nostoc sp. ATCC 43529]|nr:hypothetical protein A6S26_05430 [Nostoc sp. ATCC 43529]